MELKQLCMKRIQMLQGEMKKKEVDVCLLTDRENLIYFAGIQQVECMTLIVPQSGKAVGITLWLDVEFVREQCCIDDIHGYMMPGESVATKTVALLRQMGYENPTIGFERYFVSISYFQTVKENFGTDHFIDFSQAIYKTRSLKDDLEIQCMTEASAAVAEGMKAVAAAAKAGVRELDLAAEAEYASMKAGSLGTPFRPQIVSGKKMLSTHPFSNGDIIRNDSVLVVHIGACVNGYIAKMCRTIAIGNVPEETVNIYESLKNTQELLKHHLKDGITCDALSKLALARLKGFGYADKYLPIMGYGMGLRQSEFYPVISLGNETPLSTGMVVDFLMATIYDPQFGGPRITDTIQVLDGGCKTLTDYPNELIRK